MLRMESDAPLPRNSRDIIRRLETEGWALVGARGSHHKCRRGAETVVVPHPKKDLPRGAAMAIAKQVGWR